MLHSILTEVSVYIDWKLPARICAKLSDLNISFESLYFAVELAFLLNLYYLNFSFWHCFWCVMYISM